MEVPRSSDRRVKRLHEELEEEDDRAAHTALFATCMQAFLMLFAARQSIRARHFYTQQSLIAPGLGTAWDKMFADGDDCSFLHMLGFPRSVFMQLHEAFVREDFVVHQQFLTASGDAAPKKGRKFVHDSYCLLAVGLYYLVNRCQQKVRATSDG